MAGVCAGRARRRAGRRRAEGHRGGGSVRGPDDAAAIAGAGRRGVVVAAGARPGGRAARAVRGRPGQLDRRQAGLAYGAARRAHPRTAGRAGRGLGVRTLAHDGLRPQGGPDRRLLHGAAHRHRRQRLGPAPGDPGFRRALAAPADPLRVQHRRARLPRCRGRPGSAPLPGGGVVQVLHHGRDAAQCARRHRLAQARRRGRRVGTPGRGHGQPVGRARAGRAGQPGLQDVRLGGGGATRCGRSRACPSR